MNKIAIKNFAIWARNKLIDDVRTKTRLLAITEKGINSPLPSSTKDVQFFDIGTKEPYSISGNEIKQREQLVKELEKRAEQIDYKIAYNNIIEEVAYSWFNRLIAIRFMEVNDYLPSRVRVLSSEIENKTEPEIVTNPFAADLDFSEEEKQTILQMKNTNKLDELFRMLFIKQCNALHENLPELFEKINDYTELLLQVSFTDKGGIIYNLVNDIDEDDFDVEKEGQVEIIGWLYQFYNTEPKDETFKLLKKNVKITKERIPSATQLFTPDWIVRYMVENSLGRLWVEGHPNEELKKNWKYYLEEAEQEVDVLKQLEEMRKEYGKLRPEDIKIIDPAMGSGHILVYAFDVLMQIYESQGYPLRDAAKSILENNLYGLDIDKRAYQLSYFAVIMKARQYNRRILDSKIIPKLFAFEESNGINKNHLKYFGTGLNYMERNSALLQIEGLIDTFKDAKEYGSIIKVENYDWNLLRKFIKDIAQHGQMSIETIGIEYNTNILTELINIGEVMSTKYDVVVTNPPYVGSKGFNNKLESHVKVQFPKSKSDLFAIFIEVCRTFTNEFGIVGLVTPSAWMYNPRLESLRIYLCEKIELYNLVELGNDAFDVGFGTVMYTFGNQNNKGKYKGKYYDVCKLEKKEKFKYEYSYISSIRDFTIFENIKIAYKITGKYKEVIRESKPLSKYGEARSGLQTNNNPLYIRMWYEIDTDKLCLNYDNRTPFPDKKWFPHVKGGTYRKWFGNLENVVNWEDQGKDIINLATKLYGSYTRTVKSLEYYFCEGLTWSHTTYSQPFAIRLMDKGIISNVEGPSIFGLNENQLYVLGLLNTKLTDNILSRLTSSIHYLAGEISKFPIIISNDYINLVNEIVSQNIDISKTDWDLFETSWNFEKHPLLITDTIESAYSSFRQDCEERFTRLRANEEELNQIFIEIYDLQDELIPDVEEKDVTVARIYNTKKDFPESMTGNGYVLTKQDVAKSFLSYAVGCMFGRYSLDVEGLSYAGGEWDDNKYKSFIPDKDNIVPITDEEYLNDDIVGLFTSFVKKVYGEETLERNLSFIADALGNKGDSSREIIRNYFLKDFFKDHVKTYKKKPIYWLFDSGKKNGFKALVYLHRYDENTIGKLRVEYLHKMQRIYEGEIERMGQTIEESTDSREITKATKRQEKLIKQLQETREYDEKITHLALERISLDLDDGVKVNYEKVQTDREGKKHEVLAKI